MNRLQFYSANMNRTKQSSTMSTSLNQSIKHTPGWWCPGVCTLPGAPEKRSPQRPGEIEKTWWETARQDRHTSHDVCQDRHTAHAMRCTSHAMTNTHIPCHDRHTHPMPWQTHNNFNTIELWYIARGHRDHRISKHNKSIIQSHITIQSLKVGPDTLDRCFSTCGRRPNRVMQVVHGLFFLKKV